MKLPSWSKLAAATLLLAAPATAVVIGQSQRALAADEEAEGRIVEISPSGDELPATEEGENDASVEAPKYWIGLQGRPIDSPVLRTHLQLADDVGVLVENVVPGSPAEKAGLRQHDIIIAVDGEPISAVTALQEVVAERGKKAIELKVIRLAKERKISVTPEDMPADLQVNPSGSDRAGVGGPLPAFDAIMRQFQQGGVPGGVRVFGPGMVLGGQAFDPNQVPHGVSVSITREGEGPAEITVKKGGENWKLKSDDEEALKKLPDDVRPFVTQMLEGTRPGQPVQQGAMRFNFRDFQNMLPNDLGPFDVEIGGLPDQQALQKRADEVRKRTEEASRRLLERMEEMEKRMQEMQKQMQENSEPGRTNDPDDASQT
jgi:membrane-associated protease RseP (regulator of RpoE activity)